MILNLALWFGMHVLFHQLRPVSASGIRLELPVPSSLDPSAALLTVAAVLAVFRFKLGMVPVLLLCSAAGLLLRVIG